MKIADNLTGARRVTYLIGLASLLLCALVLIGSYLRPITETDYFKQGEQATPWVQAGLISALAALLLTAFGKGRSRILTLLSSFLALCFWYLMGLTLY